MLLEAELKLQSNPIDVDAEALQVVMQVRQATCLYNLYYI